jgi:hypothetical protein
MASVILPNIQPLWDALKQEVINVHAYWNVYKQLFGKSEERVKLLNECAAEFFLIVQNALLTDVQLSLARLAQKPKTMGKDNATLEKLLHEVNALKLPQLSSNLAKLFESYKSQCARITDRRNQEIAHASYEPLLRRYGFAPGANIPGPSRQEIENALQALRALMNFIDGHFSGEEVFYDEPNWPGDGDCLVGLLKQGMRYGELRSKLPVGDLTQLKYYGA